jgi:hypothetical protein
MNPINVFFKLWKQVGLFNRVTGKDLYDLGIISDNDTTDHLLNKFSLAEMIQIRDDINAHLTLRAVLRGPEETVELLKKMRVEFEEADDRPTPFKKLSTDEVTTILDDVVPDPDGYMASPPILPNRTIFPPAVIEYIKDHEDTPTSDK